MPTLIGQTICVKGQLSADEDIRIDGRIEGKIHLQEHALFVQESARVTAEVSAKSVIIGGAINGDIIAAQHIALRNTASVTGNITARSIAISDGADFNGRIDTVVRQP